MQILLKSAMHKMLKVSDFRTEHPLWCSFILGDDMKKQRLFILFIGLLVLFCNPFIGYADSDGSLQLNSDLITTQSGEGATTSEFAIRAKLFSKDLDNKTQDKIKNSEKVTEHIANIDFNNKSQNKLYKTNYRSIKTELFKNYSQTNVSTDDSKKTSSINGMLILFILAIPLLVLTGVVARNLTRRKRKNNERPH